MIAQYEVKMSPNLFLTALLIGLLFLAEVVIWSINLYFILKIILSLGLIFYGIYAVNRYYFLSSQKAIQKIYWSARDGWSLEFLSAKDNEFVSLIKSWRPSAVIPRLVRGIHLFFRMDPADEPRDDGGALTVPAVLLGNSIFTSNIIILNFKIPSGKIRTAILFLCQKNHADFRHLIRINNGL